LGFGLDAHVLHAFEHGVVELAIGVDVALQDRVLHRGIVERHRHVALTLHLGAEFLLLLE
jgi:hypothetical protein